MLTKDAVKEFKEIYKNEFNELLSDDMAAKLSREFLELVELLSNNDG